MKAQTGLEYLAIFSLMLLAALPIFYFAYADFQAKASHAQALLVTENLRNAADLVFAQGRGAKMLTSAYIPNNVNRTYAAGKEVAIEVSTPTGDITTAYAVINGNFTPSELPKSPGFYTFQVEYLANGNVSLNLSS